MIIIILISEHTKFNMEFVKKIPNHLCFLLEAILILKKRLICSFKN